MVERHEFPVHEKLPQSIPARDYAFAWGRLKYFVACPFDKTNLTLKKLSVNTSSVGEDLALAIRGGGKIFREVFSSTDINGVVEHYENWRKVAEGYVGREKIDAELIPEGNQIYIIKAYTLNYDDGFVLQVPIETEEYSILTGDDECPSFAFFQDKEIRQPSESGTKDANLVYAKLLEEAVSDILKVLPEPIYYKDKFKKSK